MHQQFGGSGKTPARADSSGRNLIARCWPAGTGSGSRATPSAPALGTAPGMSLFRLAPPYVDRLPLRDVPRAGEELPFGSAIGVEVTLSTPNWAEVERTVQAVRRQIVVVPVVLMIDPRAEDLLLVAARVARLPVRAVLFRGEPIPVTLRKQMTRPANLAEDVVDWLGLRGVRLTPMTAHMIRQIFARAGDFREVVPLLREMGNPESSARFRCRKKRLPSPGRWLHVARALDTAFRIQADPERPLLGLAHDLGYADHSALSNQMHRIFRLRPGAIRRTLGWEWLLDRWLTAEAQKVRRPSRRGDAAASN